jgi:hypothetical protein
MPDIAQLRRQACRAYEQGRLQSALRIGFVVGPIAAVCMWEAGAVWPTLVVASCLLVVAVALRWRQRRGFEVVTAGLQSGAVPLAGALALCRFAPACPPNVALMLCAGAGLAAGGVLGHALLRDSSTQSQQVVAAAVVGGLMAALGCLALGIGSAIGAAVGIALGTAAAAGARHRLLV